MAQFPVEKVVSWSGKAGRQHSLRRSDSRSDTLFDSIRVSGLHGPPERRVERGRSCVHRSIGRTADGAADSPGQFVCGCPVLSAPAWNSEFNSADMPMSMRVGKSAIPVAFPDVFLDPSDSTRMSWHCHGSVIRSGSSLCQPPGLLQNHLSCRSPPLPRQPPRFPI